VGQIFKKAPRVLDPAYIFSIPIEGKDKIIRGIRIRRENLETKLFLDSNRAFYGFDNHAQYH